MTQPKYAWWALLALWLVAGSRWLTDQLWPLTISSPRSAARACALGAVVAVLCTTFDKTAEPLWRKMIVLAATGAVIFVGQTAGTVMHGAAGDEYNRAVALCLVPVVVIVAQSAVAANTRLDLWPALSGLAGALLIFPLAIGGGWFTYVQLALPSIAIGIACVLAQREAKDLAVPWAVAALLAGGAAGLGAFHWLFFRDLTLQDALWQPLTLDLPIVFLTALALVLAGARRFSATYFAVIVLAIAVGATVARLHWSWRPITGLVLMAAGVWGLIRRTEPDTPGLGLAL